MPTRFTFDQIKSFTIAELWNLEVPITERTALAHDFQIGGHDGRDYMDAYAKCFDVELGDFDWQAYFGPEAGSNPLGLLGYLWQRFVRGIPARDLVGLPELTLGHLLNCANDGRWSAPIGGGSAE